MTNPSPKRVAVGLGGGISSAVAAALLKSEGYEVLAVHFKRGSIGLCRSEKPESAAAEIARILDLPLQFEDLSDSYEHSVIDPFVHGFLEGKRPVPCVACHSEVILPALERFADARGCAFFATGHFSLVRRDAATGLGRLYRSSETLPDQSYWLYRLSSASLSRLLTPMGGLSAPLIEKLAAQFELPAVKGGVLGNSSSCFAETREGIDLIEKRSPKEFRSKGNIRTVNGALLGDHPGLHRYNLGEKFSEGNPSNDDPALFVQGYDLVRHALVVGPEESLSRSEILGVEARWIRPVSGLKGLKCQARLSPQAEPMACVVTQFESARVRVRLEPPARAPLPGRAIVFYEDNEVLGGALIENLD